MSTSMACVRRDYSRRVSMPSLLYGCVFVFLGGVDGSAKKRLQAVEGGPGAPSFRMNVCVVRISMVLFFSLPGPLGQSRVLLYNLFVFGGGLLSSSRVTLSTLFSVLEG